MMRRSLVADLTSAALVLASVQSTWAQGDSDLLQRFQQQNQQAALKARQQIEKNVTEALSISAQDPDRALELLRQGREWLAEAGALSRPEKVALARKLDDGFRDARARLESRAEAARLAALMAQPPKSPEPVTAADGRRAAKSQITPIIFVPNIVPYPVGGTVTVAPVISADRRWVRINFSGGFTLFR
jgi:hypothetical protein